MLMTQALRDWNENHPGGSIKQVYLVDLKSGFGSDEDMEQSGEMSG